MKIEDKIKELKTAVRGQEHQKGKEYSREDLTSFIQMDILSGYTYEMMCDKYRISPTTVNSIKNDLKVEVSNFGEIKKIRKVRNSSRKSQKEIEEDVQERISDNDVINDIYQNVANKALSFGVLEIRRQVEYLFNKKDSRGRCLIHRAISNPNRDYFKNTSSRIYEFNFSAIKAVCADNNLHNLIALLEICGLYVHTSSKAMDALLGSVNNGYFMEVLKDLEYLLDKYKED